MQDMIRKIVEADSEAKALEKAGNMMYNGGITELEAWNDKNTVCVSR